jgi:HEAT repeat protein
MDCEEARNRLADDLTGAIDAPDRTDLHAHLDACGACRAEAGALEDLWTKLGAIAGERPDSAAMRARFAAMLEGYEHGRDGATAAALWRRANDWLSAWWPRQPLVQAGWAAALVALGVGAGLRLAPVPAPPAGDLTALRSELRDMRQMVALSLLQQQSASERLRGVSWSERIEDPGSEVVTALLDTLMHDPNVNVRLASIEALARFGEQQTVRRGAVQALNQATSPLVQIALIDFVVEVQEKSSVETLRRLARDPALDEVVRTHAALGLERLLG